MDLKEFKQRLLSEPRSNDPEMVAARAESLEHARAAKEAEQFEEKLERALQVPVREGFADEILATCQAGESSGIGTTWRWLSAAAVLVVAVALGMLVSRQDVPGDPVAEAFVAHLKEPEPMALGSDERVPEDRVRDALASVGAITTPVDEVVTYISPCVIGGVRGVHLVMTDDRQQKTTLMFIPGRNVAGEKAFQVEDTPARVFDSESGAVALFAHNGQDLEELQRIMFRQTTGRVAAASRS